MGTSSIGDELSCGIHFCPVPQRMEDICTYLTDTKFWIMAIVIILTIIVVLLSINYIYTDNFWNDLEKAGWILTDHALVVITMLWFVPIFYLGYRALLCGGCRFTFNLTVLWVLILILNFLWVYIFFVKRDPRNSWYILLALLSIVFIYGYILWFIDIYMFILSIIYLLWLVYIAVCQYKIIELNAL